jgi:ribosomal protein S18 acetylase RimI-like enzyme
MLIEKITFKDYERLEEIGKKSLPIYYDIEEICYLHLYQENTIMLKALKNEDIVGFMFCKVEEKVNNIHINSIAIEKNFRREGYGTYMIDYIKKYKKNITLNVSQINAIAINFYKKNGFIVKENKKNYYENLENNDAYLLQYNQT